MNNEKYKFTADVVVIAAQINPKTNIQISCRIPITSPLHPDYELYKSSKEKRAK